MQHWRVFYTAPRAERKCEARIQELGIEVFLPVMVVRRKWSDRTKTVQEPLFRSYIFAHVDEKERLQVLQVKGIVQTLSFGGKLASISDDEIASLKLTQEDPERLSLLTRWTPAIGNSVVVTEGPMSGLEGEVLQHRGQSYVVIRINALRQAVKINVPIEWIRGIDEKQVFA